MTDRELMQQALEALTRIWEDGLENYPVWAHEVAIDDLRERLAQPEQEPDRVKFERHWRKTRVEKKANRELPRHPLQPQTYIQDSANRHWVTWQAAVRSVAPPAQRKPLTEAQTAIIYKAWQAVGADLRGLSWGDFVKELGLQEAAHGIKENA